METPEHIRMQYARPDDYETTEQRRKRLINKRAAKYRYYKSMNATSDQERLKNSERQRRRRLRLDDTTKAHLREQNRVRQQLHRDRLTDTAKQEIRGKQRVRQQLRRQALDDHAREVHRAKERQRLRSRRAKERALVQVDKNPLTDSLPRPSLGDASSALHVHAVGSIQLPPPSELGNSSRTETDLPNLQPHLRQHQQQQHPPLTSIQFMLPPTMPTQPSGVVPFSERHTSLPHLPIPLPQASSLLNPQPPTLFHMLSNSVSSGLPGTLPIPTAPSMTVAPSSTQPPALGTIVLPPPHRSLPPLPDFLNSRETFDPSSIAVNAFFPSINELGSDFQESDGIFRS